MNTNFSRPSLGLNQSSLFQASNDLATSYLSRNEFAKDPNGILNKYDLPPVEKSVNFEPQKTSEICTPAILICVAALLVAVGVVAYAVAGVAAVGFAVVETVHTLHHIDTVEVDFANLTPSLSNENYMGIC